MEHLHQCVPDWAKAENGICPYGFVIHVPTAAVTVPRKLSLLTVIAVGYGLVPFLTLAVNVAAVVAWRRLREASWLMFIVVLECFIHMLKWIIKENRPASCLPSCGMPSGHSAYAFGMLCLVVQDCVFNRPDIQHSKRLVRSIAVALILLPVPWSRVETGDHSVEQVIIGCVLGVVGAALWLLVWPWLQGTLLSWAVPEASTEPVLDMSLLDLELSNNRRTRQVQVASSAPQSLSAAAAASAAARGSEPMPSQQSEQPSASGSPAEDAK